MTHPVAQTIASQIGGVAFFMMGAQHLVADKNALTFSIKGCREINKVRVALDPDDTYTVQFWKIRTGGALSAILVHEASGVYADGLKQVIEHRTGLFLAL